MDGRPSRGVPIRHGGAPHPLTATKTSAGSKNRLTPCVAPFPDAWEA